MTYDEIALHRFKQQNPIRCFRTKGNYGQGFYLGEGYYGHVGKELVVFSSGRLRTFKDFRFDDETFF
jgi:hypothetical protein